MRTSNREAIAEVLRGHVKRHAEWPLADAILGVLGTTPTEREYGLCPACRGLKRSWLQDSEGNPCDHPFHEDRPVPSGGEPEATPGEIAQHNMAMIDAFVDAILGIEDEATPEYEPLREQVTWTDPNRPGYAHHRRDCSEDYCGNKCEPVYRRVAPPDPTTLPPFDEALRWEDPRDTMHGAEEVRGPDWVAPPENAGPVNVVVNRDDGSRVTYKIMREAPAPPVTPKAKKACEKFGGLLVDGCSFWTRCACPFAPVTPKKDADPV